MKKKILILLLVVLMISSILIMKKGEKMFESIKNIFGKKNTEQKFSNEIYEKHYEAKQKAIERILGKMHDSVGHAIIPFQVGGTVDMYYFPNVIRGTAFVTMELIEPDGTGPIPNRMGTYELVAFTKHSLSESDKNEEHPFNKIERRICGIFTVIGNYSFEAKLEPGETIEIPGDEGEEGTCLVLDEYKREGVNFEIDGKKHGLLLCIEIFRSEMVYAMENGSAKLLAMLKEKGYYPYSDLDRQSVIGY